MSAATKVRIALERAEAELPHLSAPDGTVAIAIDDLRAVIDEMTAMRDTLALGKRHWLQRWYGSEPQRGSSVCAATEHGLHGELIAYLGGDEETHKAVGKLVAAHNAALAQFEAVNELHQSLIRMGDFEACADPRAYVQTSNRLFDACLDAGMAFDTPSHEDWAAEFIARAMLSADMVEDVA